jgi:hypothetical protein
VNYERDSDDDEHSDDDDDDDDDEQIDENDQEQENDSNSNIGVDLHATGDVDPVQLDSDAMNEQITITSGLLTATSVSIRWCLSLRLFSIVLVQNGRSFAIVSR